MRAHVDIALPGQRDTLVGLRREYRQWVDLHGTPAGESPVAFVAIGNDQFWALRPAATWDELPAQAKRDGAAEERVRRQLSPDLVRNGNQMHGSIASHHNEVLRLASDPPVTWRDWSELLPSLAFVVLDQPVPAAADDYQRSMSQIEAVQRASWHWVFISSPGSGAFVHLIGGPGALSPADVDAQLPARSLVGSRWVQPARLSAELGRP